MKTIKMGDTALCNMPVAERAYVAQLLAATVQMSLKCYLCGLAYLQARLPRLPQMRSSLVRTGGGLRSLLAHVCRRTPRQR